MTRRIYHANCIKVDSGKGYYVCLKIEAAA